MPKIMRCTCDKLCPAMLLCAKAKHTAASVLLRAQSSMKACKCLDRSVAVLATFAVGCLLLDGWRLVTHSASNAA
eukprot:173779-Rhodomonas_salina.2